MPMCIKCCTYSYIPNNNNLKWMCDTCREEFVCNKCTLKSDNEKLKEEIEVKDAVIIALNDTIRDLKKYCIELGGFFE